MSVATMIEQLTPQVYTDPLGRDWTLSGAEVNGKLGWKVQHGDTVETFPHLDAVQSFLLRVERECKP